MLDQAHSWRGPRRSGHSSLLSIASLPPRGGRAPTSAAALPCASAAATAATRHSYDPTRTPEPPRSLSHRLHSAATGRDATWYDTASPRSHDPFTRRRPARSLAIRGTVGFIAGKELSAMGDKDPKNTRKLKASKQDKKAARPAPPAADKK